jgi:cytochrome c oxidase assembly protein subunit 15
VLLFVMVAQGIVGYIQYFTHLPALLVGIHVFGASLVWMATLWFHHGLSRHEVEAPAQLRLEEVAPLAPAKVAT